jgi:hypothetical protein
LAQARLPEQSVTQTLPLQWTAPPQASAPWQEMRLLPAELVTPAAQVDGPVHSVSQSLPWQVISPLQEPAPVQLMVLMAPPPATPAPQELVPLQVTLQVVRPH